MIRSVLFLLSSATALVGGTSAHGAPAPGPPPITYELMINGESFLVQANRQMRLQSKQKPGVTYNVAIRVAPTQALSLNTLQFQYDRGFQVEDSRRPNRRSAKLQHELGFSMLITDLGEPLDEKDRDKALQILTEPVLKSVRDRAGKDEKVTVSKLDAHQFEGAEGRGVRIRYRDQQDIDQSTLVFIMVGKTFAASCIVQFLDSDEEDVVPLLKKTFDSIRAIEGAGQPKAKPTPKAK